MTDKAGQPRAFPEAHDLTQARRLGNLGPNELTFWLDLDDATAQEATPGNRLARVYRNGALWFHGILFPPIQDAAEGKVNVTAFDPSAALERRYLRFANARSWTQVDQGAIARELVTDQTAVGGFAWYAHLEALVGGTQASVKRDRQYDIGKQVLEAIRELGEVDDGFYFRVDPVEYASAWGFGSAGAALKQVAAGELRILWPSSGVDAEALRFEYGAGTADTLGAVQRTLGMPVNQVLALGEQGSIAAQEASEAASQAEFGVWMDAPTFSDVRRASTLLSYAQAALRPTLGSAEVVTFTPGVEGPMLGDDFEVGDSGRLFARRGALAVEATVRVLECVVRAHDDGAEEITSLTVEQV